MMAPPDFDTMPSGSIKIMSDKDLEIQRLKAEIEYLIEMGPVWKANAIARSIEALADVANEKDAEIERLTANVEDISHNYQELSIKNKRLQARVDALRYHDLGGAYNQGFSDGFDSKDKTLMGIGTAADIGFNRFMALANSEVEK